MHQDEKNFLEKFKTVSKQANTVFRRLAVLNFQSIELVNEKLCFKEKTLSVCSSAFSNHLANMLIEVGKTHQLFEGDMHPLIMWIGRDIDAFGINVCITDGFVHCGPVLPRQDTKHRRTLQVTADDFLA